MVLGGLYPGLRLGDIASLTWANLDLGNRSLHLESRKTGRILDLPMALPRLSYLEKVTAGDDPNQPVFERVADRYNRGSHNGLLSKEFYQVLVSAGLAQQRTTTTTGKGN